MSRHDKKRRQSALKLLYGIVACMNGFMAVAGHNGHIGTGWDDPSVTADTQTGNSGKASKPWQEDG